MWLKQPALLRRQNCSWYIPSRKWCQASLALTLPSHHLASGCITRCVRSQLSFTYQMVQVKQKNWVSLLLVFPSPALCQLQTFSAAIVSLPLHSGVFLNGTVHSEISVLLPVLRLLELPGYVLSTIGLDFPHGVISWPCSSHSLGAESVFVKYCFKTDILWSVSCRFFIKFLSAPLF